MKATLEYAVRSRLIIKSLAFLVGIDSSARSKFESALQSPSVLPIVAFLIGIRFRRLLRKVTGQLAGNARRNDIGTASEGLASNNATTPGKHDSSPVLHLPPTPDDGSFPKVIFQTWKSRIEIPFNYAQWSTSFRRMNPDFEYVLWDDADNRRFIENYYPWFLPIYNAYPREIYRADAVRYFFLYQFGGLYVDMDTECLRPVSPLFESGDVWLGRMGSDPNFPHSIPNAIMASGPLQEFWLLAIHLLVENARIKSEPEAMIGSGPEAMTGPILLKRAYDTYVSAERSAVREMIRDIAARLPDNLQPQPKASIINLLAPERWYPIDWSNIIHQRLSHEITSSRLMLGERTKRWLFPEAFLVTYWTHSWKAPVRK
ncbi:MAG: cell surface protein [Gammaproteobacteria bacterium]|nr:cell surface protein [Gammaproteobacteria bacterium]